MTPPTKLSPKRAAEETLALFEENADAKRAASYQRFFKEPVDWFGVENKLVQQIQKVETQERMIKFLEKM